jgi:transcriptional regulator with XRE-family HTH domain
VGARIDVGLPSVGMGRKPTRVSALHTGYRMGARWAAPYLLEWGVIVGDRIRRLRRDADWRLIDLAAAVEKPEGGRYSLGYLSRLERGWTMPPLYVYVAIAAALGVEPGRLLGPDSAQLPVSEEEMLVVKLMRKLAIDPEDAVTRLVRPARRR